MQHYPLQVLMPHQYATIFVHMFSQKPAKEWLEAFAAQEGEPSAEQLTTDGILEDAQHVANWEAVVEYLSRLTVEQKSVYVPLPR